jgi:hypothetical protein
MWHAVTPVALGYDPILYESLEPKNVLVLNAGPANVAAVSWPESKAYETNPTIRVELRPGDQRVIGGCLVRVQLAPSPPPAQFAAVAWQVLP